MPSTEKKKTLHCTLKIANMLVATFSSEDNIALHFCTLKIAICMVQIMLSTDDSTVLHVCKLKTAMCMVQCYLLKITLQCICILKTAMCMVQCCLLKIALQCIMYSEGSTPLLNRVR